MSLHAALDVSHTPNGRPIPSSPVVAEWLRSTCGVLREFYFHWHFHWHCLLWVLQLAVFEQLKVGGEGRNRPYFPAVALQTCLILRTIQAKTVLSDRISFNPFGVRFGVRLI
jgi:hypothetical protein